MRDARHQAVVILRVAPDAVHLEEEVAHRDPGAGLLRLLVPFFAWALTLGLVVVGLAITWPAATTKAAAATSGPSRTPLFVTTAGAFWATAASATASRASLTALLRVLLGLGGALRVLGPLRIWWGGGLVGLWVLRALDRLLDGRRFGWGRSALLLCTAWAGKNQQEKSGYEDRRTHRNLSRFGSESWRTLGGSP